MPATVRTILLLGLLALLPGFLTAQARLHGVVRDSTQGLPIPQVEVLVAGMNLSTLTDAQGRYALSIPLGFHTVTFRRVGYHPLTRQLRLATADSVRLDVRLLDQAQRLDPVEVEAAPPRRTWPPGIDDRIRDGFGTFITDSVLRKFDHSTLSNALLSRSGGIRIRREHGRNIAMASRGGRASFNERGENPNCFLTVWVDGILFWEPDAGSGFRTGQRVRTNDRNFPPDLDRWLVTGLEAVEIYTAAQVPAQYRGGSAGCGAILIWTRKQAG